MYQYMRAKLRITDNLDSIDYMSFKTSFPKSNHTTLGAYQKVRLDTIFVIHTRNPQIPTGLLPFHNVRFVLFLQNLEVAQFNSTPKTASTGTTIRKTKIFLGKLRVRQSKPQSGKKEKKRSYQNKN